MSDPGIGAVAPAAVQPASGGALVPKPTNAPVPPATPWWKSDWAVAAPNVILLVAFIYLGIGALTEISSRLNDYRGLQTYLAGLAACGTSLMDGAQPKPGCKQPDANMAARDIAQEQTRNYDRLNGRGTVGDRCGVAAVIVSSHGGFHEDCVVLRQRMTKSDASAKANNKPVDHANADLLKATSAGDRDVTEAARSEIEPILYPHWSTYAGQGFDFDARPREDLFFFFIILSAGIGSLVAGLRTTGLTTLRDVAIGCALGFAVYLLIKGGHFVFFTGTTTPSPADGPVVNDNLNPYSAALAGFLVGLFKDQAVGLFGGVFADASKAPSGAPAVKKA